MFESCETNQVFLTPNIGANSRKTLILEDNYFINKLYYYIIILMDMRGIGDWGLGIGPNPQSPIPNPQSPIPNPQ